MQGKAIAMHMHKVIANIRTSYLQTAPSIGAQYSSPPCVIILTIKVMSISTERYHIEDITLVLKPIIGS